MKGSAWTNGCVVLLTMGAAHGQTTWYVDDDNCPGPGTGTEGDPYCSIQTAIDAATTMDGDEVVVAEGEYFENINFNGKAITLRSSDPTNPSTIVATIINGGGIDTVVTCESGEGPGTVLSGFLVTNGSADDGGGMYNFASSPTVTNCAFSGNSTIVGGGMYNFLNSNPTVTNCTFSGNTAGAGGGMYNQISSPTVTSCTFSGNSAEFSGGGMNNVDGSNATVTNCTFSGNTAGSDGGGMRNRLSSPTVTGCTLDGNTASTEGGGIHNNQSGPTVTSSAICRNTPNQIAGDPITDGGGNSISDDHCVPLPPLEPLPADLDGDGDVDLIDYGLFAAYFTGPL